MKKLFLAVSFFIFCFSAVFAQDNPQNDPEKIYLFDVKINVKTDGKIKVTENITLNVKHEEIRRGITRILPNKKTEKAQAFSLLMDGKEHPFFTEKDDDNLEINFGDDNFISEGKHTYTFGYEYIGALDSWQDYDDLYWNVTGNDWVFAIDKARAEVTFPEGVKVKKDGISLYTGERGAKKQDAKQTGDLVFETVKPLAPEEGFTISIPFEKGIIVVPEKSADSNKGPHFVNLLIERFALGGPIPPIKPHIKDFPFLTAVVILIVYILFCFITWVRHGRDPFYPGVTQFDPPKNISPAFMYYMGGGKNESKLMTCAILSLAMKGYIEIKEEKDYSIVFVRKKTDIENLPPDEKMIMEKLSWSSVKVSYIDGSGASIPLYEYNNSNACILNKSSGETLGYVREKISRIFQDKRRNYIHSGDDYKLFSFLFLCVLTFLPVYVIDSGSMLASFINIAILIWSFITLKMFEACFTQTSLHFVARFFIVPLLVLIPWFIILPIFLSSLESWAYILCEIPFIIGVFIHYTYATLIENVTLEGKKYFEHLKGFKKYMTIAEAHRVEESNPVLAERIFCDYLPYAFALGLYNKWMQKFATILSRETIQRCIENTCGNEHIIRQGLSNNLKSFMSSPNVSSGGSSSGSYGGGSSGGGHGGGGGRGR